MAKNNEAHIFDDVFRTMEEHIPELISPLAYSELHDLMKRVQEYVLKKRENLQKGVQQVMGGHVLESWKEQMIRIGRTEGRTEGLAALVNSLKDFITDKEALYQAIIKYETYKDTPREEVFKYLE